MRPPPPGPDAPAVRARAVELVRPRGLPRAQVARDRGLHAATRRRWVQPAALDAGQRDGLTTEEQAEWTRLRREHAVLEGV